MTDIASLVGDNLSIWTGAMERRSGAGRGGGKRISLYGIERLRALILDLAVRGRLVPQDPQDESASELLERIAKEKAQLVKAGKARELVVSPVATDDALFEIPTVWAWTRLGAIGDWGSGSTPPRSKTELYGGGITWLKSGELNDNPNLSGSEETITEAALEVGSFRINSPGDVLIAMYGATIGRVAILTETAVTNQAVCGCSPFTGVLNRFLFLFLLSQRERFRAASEGGAQPNISKIKIVGMPFPLPPLAEQQRIVAKLDELMALCDGLEEESAASLEAHQRIVDCLLATLVNSRDATDLATSWSRLEAHFDTLFTTEESIDALKRTVLEFAVQGKLVEHSSANWPIYALGDYVIEAAAGWSPQCNEVPRSEGSWGVLKVSAVTWGHFKPEENKELPSSLAPRPEHEVKPGDFLISRANTAELVAKSVVVPPNCPDKLMMSDKIIRIKFNDKIDPHYVNLINSSPYARAYYVRVAGGTSSSMKNVSQSQIRSLKIPVPDIADQRRVVATVDGIFAVCDALASYLAEASETQKQLADAIVEKATA